MVLWGIFLYLLLSLVIITSVSRNLHLFLCCYDSFHCMNGGVCHVICLLTGTSGSWTWRGISCRLCLVVPCCSICSTSMSKITSCTPCSGKNTPRISLRYLNLYNLNLYDWLLCISLRYPNLYNLLLCMLGILCSFTISFIFYNILSLTNSFIFYIRFAHSPLVPCSI